MTNNSSKDLVLAPSGSLEITALSEVSSSVKPVYLSLVIPTYNESKNILAVVHLLSDLLNEALVDNYELIVVDDDSYDRTWGIAQELTKDYPRLRVMRRQGERGLSTLQQ